VSPPDHVAPGATGPGGEVEAEGDRRYDELDVGLEPPGADEVTVVPWSLLLRRRVAGRLDDSPRGPWVVLAASLLGVFTASFTITVLTVSLPEIADDLGSTASVLTWAITAPSLAMAVLGPIAGKLSDRLGARPVYLWSLVGVTVFSAAAVVAWNAGSLIAFRFVGAAVGAAAGPAALSMINRSFPPARRAQAMGYWSLVGAGAPVLGVVIGGPLVDNLGWRWIFVLQTPIALAALVVGFLVLPHTERGERVRFDILGSALLAFGVGGVLVALNRGPEMGWTNPLVLGGFLVGPVLLAWFVRVENRVEHPLIPMHYFRKRNFTFPFITLFLANFTYMGGFILTPLLLNEVLDYSTTKTGLVSIVRPLAFSIAGPVAGYMAVKWGERTIGVAGSLFLAASTLGLAAVGTDTSLWWIEISLILSGIGMGATAPAMIASVANAVDVRDLGVASAASQTMSQIGVVAGMQILLTVQAGLAATQGDRSYAFAYYVGTAVALGAAVAAMFVTNSKRLAERDEPVGVEA
jgi:EmrB/QacA subfamily drug resistance transporter